MSNDATTTWTKKSIRTALILAGVQIVGALLLTLANKLGWISSEITTRGVMVLIGLMLVVIGNSMPKKQEGPPSQTVDEVAVRHISFASLPPLRDADHALGVRKWERPQHHAPDRAEDGRRRADA